MGLVKVRFIRGLRTTGTAFCNGEALRSAHCIIRQEARCAGRFTGVATPAVCHPRWKVWKHRKARAWRGEPESVVLHACTKHHRDEQKEHRHSFSPQSPYLLGYWNDEWAPWGRWYLSACKAVHSRVKWFYHLCVCSWSYWFHLWILSHPVYHRSSGCKCKNFPATKCRQEWYVWTHEMW